MKLLLLILAITMTNAGEEASNGLLEEAKELFSSELGMKKCGEHLSNCHAMSVVLGVLVLGLFIINVSTVAWFNRDSIGYACSRLMSRFRGSEPEPPHEVLHNESDAYFH